VEQWNPRISSIHKRNFLILKSKDRVRKTAKMASTNLIMNKSWWRQLRKMKMSKLTLSLETTLILLSSKELLIDLKITWVSMNYFKEKPDMKMIFSWNFRSSKKRLNKEKEKSYQRYQEYLMSKINSNWILIGMKWRIMEFQRIIVILFREMSRRLREEMPWWRITCIIGFITAVRCGYLDQFLRLRLLLKWISLITRDFHKDV
jgi:hypothetical protein